MLFTLEDEGRSVSPRLSPGRVEDREELLRVVYAPEHILNGKLVPAAIPSDDLKSRGFSTDRFLYKIEDIMRNRAHSQMARMPGQRQEKKISKFLCGDIRQIRSEEGNRELIVVDEVDDRREPVNTAHAAIYSAHRKSPSALKEIKGEMVQRMQSIHSFDEIFGRGE